MIIFIECKQKSDFVSQCFPHCCERKMSEFHISLLWGSVSVAASEEALYVDSEV